MDEKLYLYTLEFHALVYAALECERRKCGRKTCQI